MGSKIRLVPRWTLIRGMPYFYLKDQTILREAGRASPKIPTEMKRIKFEGATIKHTWVKKSEKQRSRTGNYPGGIRHLEGTIIKFGMNGSRGDGLGTNERKARTGCPPQLRTGGISQRGQWAGHDPENSERRKRIQWPPVTEDGGALLAR